MPRRLHLFHDDLPAFEVVEVESVVTSDAMDMQYKVVRPVERLEHRSYRIPLGAKARQTALINERNDAFNREMFARERARRAGGLL